MNAKFLLDFWAISKKWCGSVCFTTTKHEPLQLRVCDGGTVLRHRSQQRTSCRFGVSNGTTRLVFASRRSRALEAGVTLLFFWPHITCKRHCANMQLNISTVLVFSFSLGVNGSFKRIYHSKLPSLSLLLLLSTSRADASRPLHTSGTMQQSIPTLYPMSRTKVPIAPPKELRRYIVHRRKLRS